MTITYTLDLNRYTVGELIELCEDGVITIGELKASDRACTEFGDELKRYIKMKIMSETTKTNVVTSPGTVMVNRMRGVG